MNLWTRAFCAALSAWVSRAADAPVLLLRVAEPSAARPALEALTRYPASVDAVAFAAPPGADAAGALAALGLPVAQASEGGGVAPSPSDDHAPRALLGAALLAAAGPQPAAAARLGGGRLCASGKSAHGLCVESALRLAYGAAALEYDLFAYGHEPAGWVAATYLSELTLWRPFLRAYARFNEGTRPGGALPFCGRQGKPDLAATLSAAGALAPAGLPVCPGSPWPVCYLLNAASVDSLTAADIQRVLSGGALLDGGAVAALQARGLGPALQVGAQPREPDAREVFTDDPLNLNLVNYAWRPAAAREEAFALFPSNEAVRVIGRYQVADGASAEAASVLVESPEGARLAAFGFAGFGAEMSAARRRQLLLAADWVAQNRLPVFVETPSQVVAVPRVTLAGDLRSVLLLNASIDVQPPVTLRLRGLPDGVERLEWLTPKDKPVSLAVRGEAKDALVTLPALGPWQLGWLRQEAD